MQLRSHSFLGGAPDEPKLPLPRLAAYVRKAEKFEGFRLSFPEPTTIPGRKPAEADEARLFGVQLKPELLETILEVGTKANCVTLVLKPHHEIVGETDNNHFTDSDVFSPVLDPLVERVVKIDVRKER